MEIFLTAVYTILFLIIIRNHSFFKIEGIRSEALRFAFLLKVAFGILLYLVYTYYYTDRATADIFKYFDDSKIMANAILTKPLDYIQMLLGIHNDSSYFSTNYYEHMNNWFRIYDSNIFSDSHLIIRFNAFVMLFSFGYYNVHTVFICFLSFIGLTALMKFFITYAPKCKFGIFVSLFYIPSVLFWGSGVLKEGLIFFALGLFLHYSNNFFERFNFWNSLVIFGSILLLLYTKIYIFLLIFPLVIIFKSLKQYSKNNIGIAFFTVLFFTGLVSYISLNILANIDILAVLANKQHDFIALANSQTTGSLISNNQLTPDWLSFIQQLPMAIVNTFFRPIIGLDNSPMMFPAIIENLCFIILLGFSFAFPAKLNRSQKMVFHLSLWFVIGVFLLTGITTPILGAIVRYKSIALPFLGVMFSLIIDKKRIYNFSKKAARFGLNIEKKIIYKSVIH
jgi:hypothetical protein